ncbi:MAG TPA: hypothetical protein VMI54_28660 [Polyangiaceae bacterium]|nr:hypothetical protein [Polyangiaceae bacterium]
MRALSTLTLAGLFLAGCSSKTSDEPNPGASGGAGGSTSSAGSTSSGAGTNATSAGTTGSSGAANVAGQGAAGAGAGSGGAAGTGNDNGGSPAAGGGAGGRGGASGGRSAGAAGSGAGASAGAAGMTAGIASCPMPPDGTPAAAITAINTENTLRVAMGIDCADIALALCTSAQNHCNYYTENQGTMCQADSPHDEISGCPGFTGASLGDRFKAAGYTLRMAGAEDMAFLDDPAGAVMTFVNSVYHRTSILDPWMRDFGYGGSMGCDTIDFGTGTMSSATITAVYPYADETGIPTSFNGAQEGPTPPAPASGWPSGYPVTVYAQKFTVSSHVITVDGDDTPLDHEYIDSTSDPAMDLPSYAKFLYTDAPMMANTTYHVVVSGSLNGSDKTFDWKFTTGAATSGGGRRPMQ